MKICTAIKYARKARNLTQQQFGEMLGYKGACAQVYVSQYESGTRQIPINKIKKAARILDIPVETLLP